MNPLCVVVSWLGWTCLHLTVHCASMPTQDNNNLCHGHINVLSLGSTLSPFYVCKVLYDPGFDPLLL